MAEKTFLLLAPTGKFYELKPVDVNGNQSDEGIIVNGCIALGITRDNWLEMINDMENS